MAAVLSFDLVGDEAGGFAGGLGRDLFELSRASVHALDQPVQGAFDFADLGKLRLGSAKLVSHIGNLALKRFEGLAFRRMLEGFGDLVADLIEPYMQGIDRLRPHGGADRLLEPVGDLDQTLVEIVVTGESGRERGGIVRRRQRRCERRAVAERFGGVRAAGQAGGVVQVARQGAAEAFEIVKRR